MCDKMCGLRADVMVRKHVYYKGDVQGVGFRYTTMRIATNYQISGYVRNMVDGRVEAVVEGAESEVKMFLEDVADTMKRYVRDRQIIDEPYAGEFSNFDIRF